MKPITYWIQNDVIDSLVKQFGTHFEVLTLTCRRDIIAFLASEANHWAWQTTDQYEIAPRLKTLTRHEKDLLIEAIAATLTHHGNPWLENARANVAIAQKEGTPTH